MCESEENASVTSRLTAIGVGMREAAVVESEPEIDLDGK